jgi:hypothetical protein
MYLVYMIQRTITHLALISKDAQSLKTTIPRNIVKLLKLKPTDMLEWLETNKGDEIIDKPIS